MIHADMRLLDIVIAHPETENSLRRYDVGADSCVLCEHLFETLKDLAALCSLGVEDIISDLNHTLKIKKGA